MLLRAKARQRCSRHWATGAWSRQVERENWRAGGRAWWRGGRKDEERKWRQEQARGEQERESKGEPWQKGLICRHPTLGKDGNSLTACIFFFPLSADQVVLRSKGCNHLLVAAASTQPWMKAENKKIKNDRRINQNSNGNKGKKWKAQTGNQGSNFSIGSVLTKAILCLHSIIAVQAVITVKDI